MWGFFGLLSKKWAITLRSGLLFVTNIEMVHHSRATCSGQTSLKRFAGVMSPKIHLVFALPAELRTSLDEHQSALELIMTKYREQVFRLLMASKRDDPTIVTQLKEQHTTVIEADLIRLLSACLLDLKLKNSDS